MQSSPSSRSLQSGNRLMPCGHASHEQRLSTPPGPRFTVHPSAAMLRVVIPNPIRAFCGWREGSAFAFVFLAVCP